MNTLKIVNKIALFMSIAAFVFTALEASLDYIGISISYAGQQIPAEAIAVSIVTAIIPYMFIGVLAAIVAIFAKEPQQEAAEEAPQEEALTQTETEVNA